MEKKIENYLKYYIDAEVIGKYDDEDRKGYLTGVRNGGYECEIQFFEEDGFNVKEEPEFNESSDVKLCLRKLSSITDAEWSKIDEACGVMFDAQGMGALRDNFLIDTSETRCGWELVNQALNELRKRSVDVDGLIENNLAIDKDTVK